MAKRATKAQILEVLKETRKVRFQEIEASEKMLMQNAGTLQQKLFNLLMQKINESVDVKSGNFVSSQGNVNNWTATTFIQDFFDKKANPEMFRFFVDSFGRLDNVGLAYYSAYQKEGFDQFAEKTIESFKTTLGITQDSLFEGSGFVPKLLTDTTVQGEVSRAVIQAINEGQSLADFRDLASNLILGKESKLGVIESHYYTNAFDSFSVYDRTLNNVFGSELSLNYAIYQGGTIETTRLFCSERNGKVFNKETILSWQSEDWDGKKEGHNILIDAGGWKCRHIYDWISWPLAKRLKPDIERSKFDTTT